MFPLAVMHRGDSVKREGCLLFFAVMIAKLTWFQDFNISSILLGDEQNFKRRDVNKWGSNPQSKLPFHHLFVVYCPYKMLLAFEVV